MIQIRHVRVRTVRRARVSGMLLSMAIVLWVVTTALAQTPATFTNTGAMATIRVGHSATLLPSGEVLVAGGSGSGGTLPLAELYNPARGSFHPTKPMVTARFDHTATLLPD